MPRPQSSTLNPPRIPIRSSLGHVVGGVSAGTLWLDRRARFHMLRRPPAWAIDCVVLDEAERLGARRICVSDADSGRTFWADIAEFRRWAWRLDRGHGSQLALDLRYWRDADGRADEAPEARQMELDLCLT
jgi:hypothetical protein